MLHNGHDGDDDEEEDLLQSVLHKQATASSVCSISQQQSHSMSGVIASLALTICPACPPRITTISVLQNGDGGGAMGIERRRRRQKRVDDEDK